MNTKENEQSLSFKNKRNTYVNDTNTFSYGNDAPINKFNVSLNFKNFHMWCIILYLITVSIGNLFDELQI